MGMATVIYEKLDDKSSLFFECPLSEVSIDPAHYIVSIYEGNGYWNEYEYIDHDYVVTGDQMDLYVTTGNFLRKIYQAPIEK